MVTKPNLEKYGYLTQPSKNMVTQPNLVKIWLPNLA